MACAEHLVQLAIDNGSRDNATAVVVAFGDVPPAPKKRWRFW